MMIVILALVAFGCLSFGVAAYYDLNGKHVKAEIAAGIGVGFLFFPCLFAVLFVPQVFK